MKKVKIFLAVVFLAVIYSSCAFQEEENAEAAKFAADNGPDQGPEVQADNGPDLQAGEAEADAGKPEICIPNCTGKECGDDGCGGMCGANCSNWVGNACTEPPGKAICNSFHQCEFVTKDCDDKNPCTKDSCDTEEGCVNAPIPNCCQSVADCDDHNLCTKDGCVQGIGCVNAPISCTDGNICTTDICNPLTGCVFIFNTLPCDGSKCQVGNCSEGECMVQEKSCDDGNPSTEDSCDSETGQCEHQSLLGFCAKDSDCEDGNACGIDICSSLTSTCKKVDVDCDDGIACTKDSCIPAFGCVNIPDDSKCPAGEWCEGWENAGCVGCYVNADCNDGNACTVDSCVDNHCSHKNISCNDGNTCTNDSCDKVVGCQHAPVNCDDDDPCSMDVCEKSMGCVHIVVDGCGQPVPPPACNPNCASKQCGNDGCGGSCGACLTNNKCNENVTCNSLGKCEFTEKNCDDGNPCTFDTCLPEKGCLHSNIPTCCTPSCSGKVCGADGCGGSCGNCPTGKYCLAGQCEATCTPSCSGKQCGDNGCGGSCGTCPTPAASCGGMSLICPSGTIKLWVWRTVKPNGETFSSGMTTEEKTDWWVATCETPNGPWLAPVGWTIWPQCKDIVNPLFGSNCHNGTGDPASGEAACFWGKVAPGPYINK